MSKKEQFYNQYLKGKKVSDLSEEEAREVLVKLKSHFTFYKNITEEPQITKSSLRYKEANRNMKALKELRDEIITIHK